MESSTGQAVGQPWALGHHKAEGSVILPCELFIHSKHSDVDEFFLPAFHTRCRVGPAESLVRMRRMWEQHQYEENYRHAGEDALTSGALHRHGTLKRKNNRTREN